MVSGEPPLANSNSLVLPAMMFSAQKSLPGNFFQWLAASRRWQIAIAWFCQQ
jgi:hypothetical protein